MISFNRKSFRQAYLRMMQHKGSPESVGRGVAVGLFIAFFIPFSLQMLIALPLALLVRGAKFPALLFTWVSNPLTIPFLYPLQCFVGSYLIGVGFTYSNVRQMLSGLIHEPSIATAMGLGQDVVLSFLAGGLLFGAIAAFAGYIASVRWVNAYRLQKENRREHRSLRFKTRF